MKTDIKYYTYDKSSLFEYLKSSPNGLVNKEVEHRLAKNGPNTFSDKNKNTLIKIVFLQFLSPLIFILIFAGLVTLYLNEIIETVVIMSAVLINVIFSAYQEYRAETTIESLKSLIKNRASVLRNGAVQQIDAEGLVVGDIVLLNYGSRVPADCRVIEANDLRIDESILTGESIPVEKFDTQIDSDLIAERKNYAFSGTLVNNGNGVGVVVSTGDQTEIGKIAKSITSTKKVLTPVQNAVKNISWYIFIVALVIVAFIFILGINRGENLFDMLVLSSAVAVGAVPEALPISLTVILSIGVLNISKKGGLIRKLAASETLGSTSLILTDKTGTLTEGKLVLDNVLTPNDVLSDSIENSLVFVNENITDQQKQILKSAYQNITATVEMVGDDKNNWVYNGSAFETIILKSIYDLNIDVAGVAKNKLITPFNSTNKFSVSNNNGQFLVLGAPDILINNSVLSTEQKSQALANIHKLSEFGKRLIALGSCNFDSNANISSVQLMGIFAFSDTIRPHIKDSINSIMQSGVDVKIISGDLPGTVKYIGKQIGIIADTDQVLTGSQIGKMSDAELLSVIKNVKIFARVTPEDKLRIGKLYQSLGEVVAMTGDGVNDSPALKAMNIGISLASGSDVAKSASDMILVNNDFNTIVNTVKEGHNIKSNIQKVFIYLMSSSLDEVFVIAGSLIAGLALPLTALQIIWVNILTGTLPALAFAYDKNNNKHYQSSKKIFNFKVKFLAIGLGAFSSVLLFSLYYLLSVNIADIKLAQTIFFLCFSVYVLAISYSFKNLDKSIFSYNIFSNKRLNIANVIGIGFIVLTVYTKFGQRVFNLTHVPTSYLWILFGWLAVNIFLVEVVKLGFNIRQRATLVSA